MKSLQRCVLLGIIASAAQAQDDMTNPKAEPLMVAEVTGDNVYVRSGPSTNYYPVARLDRGDSVVVYETTLGWASITPPEGTFSLIHKEFVDPDGLHAGVVNGDRVWVYAGSTLSKQRYAKQLKLTKGQPVRIIGQWDQYYKIEPPDGARLWITEEYLRATGAPAAAAGGRPTAVSRPAPAPEQPAAQPQPEPAVESAGAPVVHSSADTLVLEAVPVDDAPGDAARPETIQEVEADLAQEFAKEPLQRDLNPFIERFKVIEAEGADATAREYAKVRSAQLERATEHIAALRQMNALRDQIEQERQRFDQERANLGAAAGSPETEFAIRGRLVPSAAYRNPTGPQRYRLVDPDSRVAIPATLAYVDIDPQSGIDPQQYLGRYVGVRARGRKYLEGTVNPVVVYTAEALVILSEPQGDTLSAVTG